MAAAAASAGNGSGSVVISQRAMTFDPEPTNYHLIRSEDRANVDNALMALYRLHGDREEDDLPESLRVELIDNGNCYEVYGCGYDQVTVADLEALSSSSQRVISAVIRPSVCAVVVTVQSLLGIRKQHSSVVGKERYYLSQALESSSNGGATSTSAVTAASSATLEFMQTPEFKQLASS